MRKLLLKLRTRTKVILSLTLLLIAIVAGSVLVLNNKEKNKSEFKAVTSDIETTTQETTIAADVKEKANIDLTLSNLNSVMTLKVNEAFAKFNGGYLDVKSNVLSELEKDKTIFTFDCYDSTLTAQYGNETVSKEFAVLSSDSLKEYLSGRYDLSTVQNGKVVDASVDDSEVQIYKYKDSSLFMNDTAKNDVYDMNKVIKSARLLNSTGDFTIELSDVGKLKINKLSEYSGEYGFYYGNEDNILRVYNVTDDKVYMYITAKGNKSVVTDTKNYELYSKTDKVKVYKSKNFDTYGNVDKGTIIVSSDTTSYLIRLAADDNDKMFKEILSQLKK